MFGWFSSGDDEEMETQEEQEIEYETIIVKEEVEEDQKFEAIDIDIHFIDGEVMTLERVFFQHYVSHRIGSNNFKFTGTRSLDIIPEKVSYLDRENWDDFMKAKSWREIYVNFDQVKYHEVTDVYDIEAGYSGLEDVSYEVAK